MEEIRNLTATEKLPQVTLTLALTDPDEISVGQASSVAPSLGDSRADQSSFIIDLIHEELCRGLGHRSHRSERGRTLGLSPHRRRTLTRFVARLVLIRLGTFRWLLLAVLVPLSVGPLVGTRLVAAFRLTPPTCREGVLATPRVYLRSP